MGVPAAVKKVYSAEAVAFDSVPPSTSRFDLTTYLRDRSKVAEDGRGQASGDEEGGDSRWITVPVTRSGGMDRTKAGADGYKMRAAPQSHPHLGSACDAVAGVCEPDDFVKGQIARSLFYMAVRYDGSDDNTERLLLR